MTDNAAQILTLADGRKLAYAEYGHTDGRALFYFHGAPGSRRERPCDDATLQRLGIRLIVPDRPGYGLSDFQPNRTLLDWSDDITQLADALQLKQFAVLGFSMGSAHALACAHQLGDRLTITGLLGGVAPLVVPEMWQALTPAFRDMYALAADDPNQLEQQLAPLAASPEAVLATMEDAVTAVDKEIFAAPAFRRMFLAYTTECVRQGTKGISWDMHLLITPWGFELADIQNPVHIWHGTEDLNGGITMGQYVAQCLPHCSAHFLEKEGHYSLFNHMDVILRELMSG